MGEEKISLDPEICKWIENVIGEKIDGSDMYKLLRDGKILARVAKTCLNLDTPLPHKINSPFFMMENINLFLMGCRKIGVKDAYLFMTVDLFENKNLKAVKIAIVAFSRKLYETNQKYGVIGPLDIEKINK